MSLHSIRMEAWVRFAAASRSKPESTHRYHAAVADELLAEFDKRFPDNSSEIKE